MEIVALRHEQETNLKIQQMKDDEAERFAQFARDLGKVAEENKKRQERGK